MTSDSEMRRRLIATSKNLELFQFIFLLCLITDFIGALDNMSKAMQDPTKSLSDLMFVVEKCIVTLKSSRIDNCWHLFCKLCNMHGTKYENVDVVHIDFSPRHR